MKIFSYKKDRLRKYITEINEYEASFFNLVDKVFVDQKGEMVEAMLKKTKQMQVSNNNLLFDVHYKIGQIVNRFQEQVDDLKKQQVTYYYTELIKIT